MSHEQLVEFVTDLYTNCRAARPYLDFYCDPQPLKLFQKYLDNILKELQRGKSWNSTARISKVKSLLREFASYGVSVEMVIDITLMTAEAIIQLQLVRVLKEPILKGCAFFINDALAKADKAGIFTYASSKVDKLLNGTIGSSRYISYLREVIAHPENL